MPCNPPYGKKTVTVDSASWTPIHSAFDCNNVVIRNQMAVNVKLRTDQNDPSTEDQLGPQVQEVINAPISGAMLFRGDRNLTHRFPAGSTIVYAQAAAGMGTLMVTFSE